MKGYLELIRCDLRLALREKSVIFFNYMFPLLFFFIFAELFKARQSGMITNVVNMVLVLGVLGNGLWGAGMVVVHQREQHILRRFKVAPISAAPLLVSSMVTGWLLYLPAVALIIGISMTWYGMPFPARPWSLLFMLSVGLIAFRGIGLILAAVANSMQEVNILIQLIYMPMLFLTGTLFPTTFLPSWVQTISNFLPATYLTTGIKSILLEHVGAFADPRGVLSLVLTALLGTFISVKLFRWEKGDKAPLRSKLWVVAVLAPFLVAGVLAVRSGDLNRKAVLLERAVERQQTVYIRGARIFVGDGQVMETGSVLIKAGRIVEVFSGQGPSPESLSAGLIEANGKTLLPGLIDADVRLSLPGSIASGPMQAGDPNLSRNLAAYLYSGVIAVRSAGDSLDSSLEAKRLVASGERLGAELMTCGPIFDAPGGRASRDLANIPEPFRSKIAGETLRLPTNPDDARRQVAEIAGAGADGLQAILEQGRPPYSYNRLDPAVFQAIAQEAHRLKLPLFVTVGGAGDLMEALSQGASAAECSSSSEPLGATALQQMAAKSVGYLPELVSIEALDQMANSKTDLLDDTLVEQVGSPELMQSTRAAMSMEGFKKNVEPLKAWAPQAMRFATESLDQAYRSEAPLVMGTGSGHLLLIHGPAIHRELQLWVQAGVPAKVALQAATSNAARFLGVGDRIGLIKPGYEASLVLVDGNPMTDISTTERISMVMFKGERVGRGDLLGQQ